MGKPPDTPIPHSSYQQGVVPTHGPEEAQSGNWGIIYGDLKTKELCGKGCLTSLSLNNGHMEEPRGINALTWLSLSGLTGSLERQGSHLMGPMLAKLRSESREGWRMHEGANARYPADLLSIMAFFLITWHSLGTNH